MKYKIGDYVRIRSCWININQGNNNEKTYFTVKTGTGTVIETNVCCPFFVVNYHINSFDGGVSSEMKNDSEKGKYYKVFIDRHNKYETIDENDMEKIA